MLKNSFTKGPERRRLDLRDKINDMKYNINEDIHIFISTLQNYIDDLEKIEGDLSDNSKVGILNRAIPENLRWINVFQFKDNWKKCVQYVKSIIPEIIFSNTKESYKLRDTQLLNVQKFSRNTNNNLNNNKFRNHKSSSRKNGRCRLCHKYGHYVSDRWFNKKNKSFNNKHQNKHKHSKFHNKKSSHKNIKYTKENKEVSSINKTQNEKENLFSDAFVSDYISNNNHNNNQFEVNCLFHCNLNKCSSSGISNTLSC